MASDDRKRPSVAGRKYVQKGSSRVVASRAAGGQQTATPRLSQGGKGAVRRSRLTRRFLIGSIVVAVLLVIGIGLLSWNQWLRYDDAADIQGTWLVEGGTTSISITQTDLVMTDEVSYRYSLDTFHKTIDFSFRQYGGSGSYAFSPDRNVLTITEQGPDGEAITTLVRQ